MSLPPVETSLSEFFRKAAFYRYHRQFQQDERDYKVRLAGQLQDARRGIGRDPSEVATLIDKALRSKDNNLIEWRDVASIRGALHRYPKEFASALEVLWEPDSPTDETIRRFCGFLADVGIEQSGTQWRSRQRS